MAALLRYVWFFYEAQRAELGFASPTFPGGHRQKPANVAAHSASSAPRPKASGGVSRLSLCLLVQGQERFPGASGGRNGQDVTEARQTAERKVWGGLSAKHVPGLGSGGTGHGMGDGPAPDRWAVDWPMLSERPGSEELETSGRRSHLWPSGHLCTRGKKLDQGTQHLAERTCRPAEEDRSLRCFWRDVTVETPTDHLASSRTIFRIS